MPSPKIKRFWIIMTQYNFSPKDIEWIPIDLEEQPEDWDKFITNYTKDNKTRRMFISSILKVPPVQIDLFYNAVATFCLQKSSLDSKIQFFLMFRDKDKRELIDMNGNSISQK